MGPDDFKILKFKVTQIFLRAKVMGRGRWEKVSWYLCREGTSITMSLSWDWLETSLRRKGAKKKRWGRAGQSYDCSRASTLGLILILG